MNRDATLQVEGSICLLHLHTQSAREWVDENVDEDAQFFGGALVVEPRYVADLLEGMMAYGLEVV